MAPTPGAPRLKSLGEKFGFRIQTLDLNIKLWNQSAHFRAMLDSTDTTFYDPIRFPEIFQRYFATFCMSWVEEINRKKPRWIGLSGLSYQSEFFIAEFCRMLRQKIANVKIMLGGPGTSSYGMKFKEAHLVDEAVFGDGEQEFLQILGFEFKDLEQKELTFSMNTVLPDYSDYDLSEYSNELWQNIVPNAQERGARTLFVTGSTGCIRSCTFCDVRKIWKKFFQKSPGDVISEIQYLNRNFKVHNFFFTDSLINGDKNKFANFVESMAELNNSLPVPITYEGYMICRSRQDMPPEFFDQIKASGLRKIYLGVETGSEKVRQDMRKGYRREDLDYFVSQMNRVNIEISLLLMIGYPTETEEDFVETLELMNEFYRAGYLGPKKIMRSASFNWTTIIPNSSPLREKVQQLDIDMSDGDSLWIKINKYRNQAGVEVEEANTPEMRAFRYKRLVKLLECYGLHLRKVENFLQERETHFDQNREFYWHLAKIKTLRSRNTPPAIINAKSVLTWPSHVHGERISSMVYVVYDKISGRLFKLEGLMAVLGEQIDGIKTINFLLDDLSFQTKTKEKNLEALLSASISELLENQVLEIRH